MKWTAIDFDWNQARAFLVTAEEGSLSAAARALGQTQPTLSRQVAALEDKLGVTLFERVGRTLALTDAGLDLLDHVRGMGEAASRVSLAASGQSQEIEGRVSLTASDAMSAYHLPAIVARLRERAPGVELEIVAANDIRDLQRREADIAIRHVRPEQPALIARLIGEIPARLYAATSYLDRFGRPQTVEDLSRAAIFGFDDSVRLIDGLKAHGLPFTEANIAARSNSGIVVFEMVRRGLGIGVMPDNTAALMPELECVLPDLEPFIVPVWLTTHRELHTSRRIRLVFDLLAEALLQP